MMATKGKTIMSDSRITSYDRTVELLDDDIDVIIAALASAVDAFRWRHPEPSTVQNIEKERYELLLNKVNSLL